MQAWIKANIITTEYNVCTEYSVPNTVYQIQCTEYIVPNTVY